MMNMTDRHETVITGMATDLNNELTPDTRTTLLRIAQQQRAMLVRYSLRTPPPPEQ
jgi:hypothetical protein